jgi:hypothetical protein
VLSIRVTYTSLCRPVLIFYFRMRLREFEASGHPELYTRCILTVNDHNQAYPTRPATMLPTEHSSNPAITAHQVYHLSSAKLDREACRQTPNLGRLVAHSTIIDNVRRLRPNTAVSTEAVQEEIVKDYDVGEAAIFEFDKYGAKKMSGHARSTSKAFEISTTDAEEQKSNPKIIPALKRRPPPPPRSTATYDIRNQTWRQNRPVMVRERALKVEADDLAPFLKPQQSRVH